MPEYREYLPDAALASWVACYWTRSAFTSPGEPLVHRVLPDGCADVIFDLDGTALAVGTMTTALVLKQRAAPDVIGIRFRPGRAHPFFRLPLSALTDQHVDLRELWGSDAVNVAERIAMQPSIAGRIAVIEAELLRRLGEHDPRVDAAVAWITRSGGRLPIERVAAEIGISRQHLSRRFLQHVGVTPKTFARVMRFESLVRAARSGPRDWAALAADFGYFDQAHLIAEFRELAGATPVPFFQSGGAR
jgi:AraC-like DNA-binding protein